MAIGIETKAPTMAALLVVFFQNKPSINTANIPGLTIPVYSCMNWNAWSIPPNNGAIIQAMISATPADNLPIFTVALSVAFLFMYCL